MKKLLIITLVTAVGMGSSLQALKVGTKAQQKAKQTQKTVTKKAKRYRTLASGYVKPKPMTVGALQKKINQLQKQRKSALKQKEKYISELLTAAKKGNGKDVRKLARQISSQKTKIDRYRSELEKYARILQALKRRNL